MAKRDYTQEIATALKAGYVHDLNYLLPDPDPILAKIGHSAEIYRQILADSKVCACVEQRKAGCLAMLWDIQGNDSNAEAVDIIKTALQRLDMPRVISDILDAVLWGFQPLEVLWEVTDGLILPAKVIGKPSHWFRFSANNELRFLSTKSPVGEPLPERKFLLAQHHATYTNPYGEKILPKCFWPVTFKRGGWKWWVTATEKFGSPFVVGKVPRGTDTSEIDKVSESLEALVQDVTAVIPNDTAIEIMDGSNSADSPHQKLIEQCNSEIALAILGQTLTTEVGSTGSYAASKTHNDVRSDITSGDKRMVEHTLQTLVGWIVELNWDGIQAPTFSMWHEDDVDKALAERDKILTETGLKFTRSYYIKSYGLTDEDFEIVETQPQIAAFAEGKRDIKTVKSTVKRDINSALSDVERFLDVEQGAKLIRPCLDLLAECSNYDEVLTKLFDLFPELDTSLLVEALTRAMYLAELEGGNDAKRSNSRR